MFLHRMHVAYTGIPILNIIFIAMYVIYIWVLIFYWLYYFIDHVGLRLLYMFLKKV